MNLLQAKIYMKGEKTDILLQDLSTSASLDDQMDGTNIPFDSSPGKLSSP